MKHFLILGIIIVLWSTLLAGDPYNKSLRKEELEEDEDVEESELLTHELITGPEITEEPKDSFTARGKPAILTCQARHALSIHFRCNGHASKANTVDFVDPMTGIRQMEAVLEVPSSKLEKLEEPYSCICYAWSSIGNVESRKALIKLAQLRKNFGGTATSRKVPVGETIQLDCMPPEGSPKPEIFWLHNGKPIMLDDNVDIDTDGNLVIQKARLTNEGNYTCGVKSIAGQRLGETAYITIIADGGWSPWGQWSDCSSRCGRGQQTRTRSCTNPPPRNGGQDCKGDYSEKSDCHIQCNINSVDGRWSSWSTWTLCGSDCKQHRHRSCTNPPPSRGGRHCSGKDQTSSNCTGGHCKPFNSLQSTHDHNYYADQEPHSPSEQANLGGIQSIALVIGMALAAIILGFTFLIALRFWPKNKRDQSMYSVPVTGVISVPPDLTQSLSRDPRLQEYLTERKLEPGITIPLLQQLYAPNLPPPSPMQCRTNTVSHHRSRTPSSTGKPPRSDSPQSGHGHPSSEGTPGSEYDIYDTISMTARASVTSGTIPQLDTDCVSWASIGPQGGRINLPHLGVSMTVPPGAIKKGKYDMYMAVLKEDKDRPNLSEEQTILSPILQCGPTNVPLVRPVIITFEHCAQIPAEKWLISVLSADCGGEEENRWRRVVSLGQENLNTPLYCQMDSKSCHIQTDKLSRYTLVGESQAKCFATKSLTLAAFVSRPHSDYSIRIYCVEDTKAALQSVIAAEDGVMLENPKSILLHDGGANLCLNLEDLSPGWTFKPGANYQEIPFTHVWSSKQSQLHCSFTLQQTEINQSLCCKVTVYQRGNQSHRQILNIQHTAHASSTPSSPIYRNLSEMGPNSNHLMTKSLDLRGGGTVSVSVIPIEGFRLSQEARKKLCSFLDPPHRNGNDWRRLAAELGMDRYTNYFATKPSPTNCILDLWEARHREATAQSNLINILRIMGRQDVVASCEKLFGSWV